MKLGFKVQANFGASWALIGFLLITLWQKCMLYLEGEDSVDRVRSGVSTRVHATSLIAYYKHYWYRYYYYY